MPQSQAFSVERGASTGDRRDPEAARSFAESGYRLLSCNIAGRGGRLAVALSSSQSHRGVLEMLMKIMFITVSEGLS